MRWTDLESVIQSEINSMLCYDLEGWDREGGREMQEGRNMEIYVYI